LPVHFQADIFSVSKKHFQIRFTDHIGKGEMHGKNPKANSSLSVGRYADMGLQRKNPIQIHDQPDATDHARNEHVYEPKC